MPLRLRLLPSPADNASAGDTSGPTQERAVELPDDTREIRIGQAVGHRGSPALPVAVGPARAHHPDRRRVASRRPWTAPTEPAWTACRLRRTSRARSRPARRSPSAPCWWCSTAWRRPSAAPNAPPASRGVLVADLLAGSPDAGAPVLAVVDGVPPQAPLRLTTIDKRYVIGPRRIVRHAAVFGRRSRASTWPSCAAGTASSSRTSGRRTG